MRPVAVGRVYARVLIVIGKSIKTGGRTVLKIQNHVMANADGFVHAVLGINSRHEENLSKKARDRALARRLRLTRCAADVSVVCEYLPDDLGALDSVKDRS